LSLPFSITPLSLNAALVRFEPVLREDIHAAVMGLYRLLQKNPFEGFIEAVPAFASLAVYYDAVRLLQVQPQAFAFVRTQLETLLNNLEPGKEETSLLIEIPVHYGGTSGPDIEFVAASNNITTEDVIALHTGAIYRVYMLGFMPGFAYMGITHEKLHINRREQPRLQVPAGSVALAGQQTGIYPSVSPGGWQIIGRTELIVFDEEKDPPNLFFPGDRVKFIRLS
jgi:inhibitor of KinA